MQNESTSNASKSTDASSSDLMNYAAMTSSYTSDSFDHSSSDSMTSSEISDVFYVTAPAYLSSSTSLNFSNRAHFDYSSYWLADYNDTFLAHGPSEDPLEGLPYPSLYGWDRIIASAVIVTVIMLVIVAGNVLVILAIARDRHLTGLQNWFIASLAVSDLFVGLFVMPLTLAQELMGYWAFGRVMCDLWLSTDVLLCTASILNLVLISLDRYWSITRAIAYVRLRTRRAAAGMIAAVWVLSMTISLPPLVGWKRPQPTLFEYYPLCELSEEPGYVIYSTMGSFYLPLIVMVLVYFKIYLAARGRARRNLGKRPRLPQKNGTAVHVEELQPIKSISASTTITSLGVHQPSRVVPTASALESAAVLGPSCPYARGGEHGSGARGAEAGGQGTGKRKEGEVAAGDSARDNSAIQVISVEAQNAAAETNPDNPTAALLSKKRATAKEACSGQSGHKTPVPLAKIQDVGCSDHVNSDADRFKRRLARARERRATLVLGIVMASFIGCWLPFFSIYPITLLVGVEIHPMFFAVIFWLGYCNSALNPIIYTIFNREFRMAFKRIVSGWRNANAF